MNLTYAQADAVIAVGNAASVDTTTGMAIIRSSRSNADACNSDLWRSSGGARRTQRPRTSGSCSPR